jgi:tetratricopeptide (TPR) repeat protein
MTWSRVTVTHLLCFGLLALGCQQNSSQSPTPPAASSSNQPSSSTAAPPPAPQPPREDRSLAFVDLDVGKFSMEAIQANKQRVEQNPDDAQALVQLGHANYMIQRIPTAKDYYERAVHANGSLVEARLGLSNCYALMNQLDEALRELQVLLETEQNQPIALYNQGLLMLYGKQDRAGAERAWERLVQHHPGDVLAQRASAQLGQL